MDSQRLHLRSTIIVDQALLDQFPDIDPEFELLATGEARIVANTLIVSDGTLEGYHLKLVADSITAFGPSGPITVGLVNQIAPNLFNGRAGHPLTVIAAKLNGGQGISRGQQGGKGPKGRDGVEMPQIPPPDHEPDDPQGPPIQDGRDGEKGGLGMKGGDGGPVTLVLMEPSPHAANWFGAGGLPGEGGNGGLGEPMPFPSIDGLPGDEGDPGPAGDDKPATVEIVGLEGYRQAVSEARALGEWATFRQQLAVEEFHRENFSVALDEGDSAQRLIVFDVPPTIADELPTLVRDNRTITGVARDQDLVPDVDLYAREYSETALKLHDAITVGGALLTDDPKVRLEAVKTALRVLTSPGGELTVQTNELAERSAEALATVVDLRARTASTITRLENLIAFGGADPSISLAGDAETEFDASDIAAALAETLGAKDEAAAPTPAANTVLLPEPATGPPFRPDLDPVTLLPANLELLVHRSVRNRRIITAADAATIAARAIGLAPRATWEKVAAEAADDDGVPVAVHLGRVAADLRAAVGDRRVLDLLIELAEISHVWRLARARMEQILAGARTVARQRLVAVTEEQSFTPIEPRPSDLLSGLRCLLDALSWRADRADRAADILTFGLTRAPATEIVRYPLRPQLDSTLARLAPIVHSPDWERELAEASPGHFSTIEYDLILGGLTSLDHSALYTDYLRRGIPLVGEAPPRVVREFRKADRPDVFARLASGAGNFWMDVTLDDLAGPQRTIPHRETRVVGIKISMEFEGTAPASDVTLFATHTGLSVQRDLDGTAHRQQMLPASVQVDLSIPTLDDARAIQTLEGETLVDESRKADFAAYGRGAAAGWLIAKADNTVELDGLEVIRVEIAYEGIVEHGTVSLRSVTSAPGALQVGADLPIRVRLTAPAGPNGAAVVFSSSDPTVIKAPGGVIVPAGTSEAVAVASVVGVSGGVRPVISARTADGVTRQVRPIVPEPRRLLTASVRLGPDDGPGTVAAVIVLPGEAGGPGEPLATFGSPPPPPGTQGEPSRVHHLGADLEPIRQAAVGQLARSLAFDPRRNRIYVSNPGGTSINVSMLDGTTLKTLAERVVGSMIDVEVDSVAGLVYATRFNPGRVVVLSADDLSIVEQITDDEGGRLRRSLGMEVVPASDGSALIYVARIARGIEDEESAVTQIRRNPDGSHELVQSLRFAEVLTQPIDLAVDPVHNLVFVACLGGNTVPPQLIVLDHPTMNELGRVRLFSTGRAVAARPGSGLAYVVGEAGLMIVDAMSHTMVSRVPTGGFPLAVAVDPDTGIAYAGRRDDATLVRIDTPRSATPVFW